jgi:hypothetical protein
MRQPVANNDVSMKPENIVGIRCQAMLNDNIEDLLRAIVNCRVCVN